MTTSTASEQTKGQETTTAFYVYGIVPGDVEVTEDAEGVGDPPSAVTLIREGEVGALVSEIDTNHPLGQSEDLMKHEKLLDGIAEAGVPVLPIRFGAVMTSEEAITDELLAPYEGDFAAALEKLEGHAEFTVRIRFKEKAILQEILEESEEISQLREQARNRAENDDQGLLIQLGELVNEAIEAKRQEETQRLVEALEEYCEANSSRDPSHEYDAAYVAFLVNEEQQEDFSAIVEDLATEWEGRGTVRLLGPIAPYDFVNMPQPGE